jgi:ABC-type lipoprotein release transport system permease subunit
MAVVGIGLAVGLAIAVLVGWLLQAQIAAMLVDVSPIDPGTYVATAGVLCLVALAASLVPAHRASRIDPVNALKQE